MSAAKKPPSLAILDRNLAGMQIVVEELSKRLNDLANRPARPHDTEATVLRLCVEAMDGLENIRSSRLTGNWGGNNYAVDGAYVMPSTPAERVLAYLRLRYGVPDPTLIASDLLAERDRLQRRVYDLEQRLAQVTQAVQS